MENGDAEHETATLGLFPTPAVGDTELQMQDLLHKCFILLKTKPGLRYITQVSFSWCDGLGLQAALFYKVSPLYLLSGW